MSGDDFTPTTENVRDAYSIDVEGEYRDPINAPANRRAAAAAFDRWLQATLAAAWDAGFHEGDRNPFTGNGNPYRKATR